MAFRMNYGKYGYPEDKADGLRSNFIVAGAGRLAQQQRIFKNPDCRLEPYPMLLEIRPVLLLVPFIVHALPLRVDARM